MTSYYYIFDFKKLEIFIIVFIFQILTCQDKYSLNTKYLNTPNSFYSISFNQSRRLLDYSNSSSSSSATIFSVSNNTNTSKNSTLNETAQCLYNSTSNPNCVNCLPYDYYFSNNKCVPCSDLLANCRYCFFYGCEVCYEGYELYITTDSGIPHCSNQNLTCISYSVYNSKHGIPLNICRIDNSNQLQFYYIYSSTMVILICTLILGLGTLVVIIVLIVKCLKQKENNEVKKTLKIHDKCSLCEIKIDEIIDIDLKNRLNCGGYLCGSCELTAANNLLTGEYLPCSVCGNLVIWYITRDDEQQEKDKEESIEEISINAGNLDNNHIAVSCKSLKNNNNNIININQIDQSNNNKHCFSFVDYLNEEVRNKSICYLNKNKNMLISDNKINLKDNNNHSINDIIRKENNLTQEKNENYNQSLQEINNSSAIFMNILNNNKEEKEGVKNKINNNPIENYDKQNNEVEPFKANFGKERKPKDGKLNENNKIISDGDYCEVNPQARIKMNNFINNKDRLILSDNRLSALNNDYNRNNNNNNNNNNQSNVNIGNQQGRVFSSGITPEKRNSQINDLNKQLENRIKQIVNLENSNVMVEIEDNSLQKVNDELHENNNNINCNQIPIDNYKSNKQIHEENIKKEKSKGHDTSEAETCVVCFKRRPDAVIPCKNKPKHKLHKKCLADFFYNNSNKADINCPICRGNINLKKKE